MTTLKTCFKCGVAKPRIDFYAHPRMGDGLLGKCKNCARIDVRSNRASRAEYYRAFDKSRANATNRVAARQAYMATVAGKASHRRSADKWAQTHPLRRQASHIVGNAIRDGKLKPWPICAVPECDRKPQAHHPDYSRPLDVVWLCPSHHREVHAMAKEAA